ncbi:MAG: HDOD domain-containing protein [Planctomycetota bacterium]|jgi:putative nucleotidyltransferase with HDIG domain
MGADTGQEIRDRVNKMLGKVEGLPTLPTMLGQMNKMMVNPRTSAKEIAQLISSDPAITSRVLRVVNSSFYGFPNRITTITHAIVILGFNTVKSIVLSSSIFDAFKKGEGKTPFDRQAFWRHSIGCGAAARVIGKRLKFPTVEELFIAGLLHDIGKVVMDQFLREKFTQILGVVKQKNCHIVPAEEEVLGLNHSEIGAWLFEKWNLSKGLIECIRHHHNPALASQNPKAVSIIHGANILTRALRFGSGGDDRIPEFQESAWNELGLETEELDRLLQDTAEEIEHATIFLDFI